MSTTNELDAAVALAEQATTAATNNATVEGNYAAVVKSASYGVSPNAGTPGFFLNVDVGGRVMQGTIWLSAPAKIKAAQASGDQNALVEACKANVRAAKVLKDVFGYDLATEGVKNINKIAKKPCSVNIGEETWEGKTRMRIKFFNKPGHLESTEEPILIFAEREPGETAAPEKLPWENK